ncbi:hypothetical protein BH10PSE7_BH10PSE7_01160 [soil metagenome]
MRTRVLVAGALALAATISSANALTVTNSDKIAHKFMVAPSGGKQTNVMLKAAASGTYDCAKGCQLKMGAKKLDVTANTDKVWIKGGKFTM